jgi:hypothetical protein
MQSVRPTFIRLVRASSVSFRSISVISLRSFGSEPSSLQSRRDGDFDEQKMRARTCPLFIPAITIPLSPITPVLFVLLTFLSILHSTATKLSL